jgi:chemotaxis protein MotB
MERAKKMGKKKSFSLLILLCFLLGGCVSKERYVELEGDYFAAQQRLNAQQKQHAELKEKHRKALYTNRSLMNTIEDLRFELQQEKTAVVEKEQNIAELDLLKKQTETELKEKLAERDAKIEELTRTRREIEASLKEQIEKRDIKIEEIEGKLKVVFVDKILFGSGSVKIKARGREVLLKLADTFREVSDQHIVVEGHTDDVQIGQALQARFPTNWELSTARAAAVVRFLQDKAGIQPERLTASGSGSHRPVASNETEQGRRQNRRIEIILAPRN